MKYVILMIATSLSGCASPQQQASIDAATCQSYGAALGTREYYECRMIKDNQHAADRAAALAQMNDGIDTIIASRRPY